MIYVLEDDPSIRKLVTYAINSHGMESRGFERPSQFWEAMQRQLPSLILLDIMLPEEDGLQILKRLRSTPSTFRTPVIMLTAKETEYDKVTGLDAGADDYIAKPFGILELMARIRAVLRHSTTPHPGQREHTFGPLYLRQPRIIRHEKWSWIAFKAMAIQLRFIICKGRTKSDQQATLVRLIQVRQSKHHIQFGSLFSQTSVSCFSIME